MLKLTEKNAKMIAILEERGIPILRITIPVVIITFVVPDDMRGIFDLIETICNLTIQGEDLKNLFKLNKICIQFETDTPINLYINYFEDTSASLTKQIQELETIFKSLNRSMPDNIMPTHYIIDAIPKDLRNFFEQFITICNQMVRIRELVKMLES